MGAPGFGDTWNDGLGAGITPQLGYFCNPSKHPLKTEPNEYPLLVGVDGRALTTIRRFPGCKFLVNPVQWLDDQTGTSRLQPIPNPNWGSHRPAQSLRERLVAPWTDELGQHPMIAGFKDAWCVSAPVKGNQFGGHATILLLLDETVGYLHLLTYLTDPAGTGAIGAGGWRYDVLRQPMVDNSLWDNSVNGGPWARTPPVSFKTEGGVQDLTICQNGPYVYVAPSRPFYNSEEFYPAGSSHKGRALLPMVVWWDQAYLSNSLYGLPYGPRHEWLGTAFEDAEEATNLDPDTGLSFVHPLGLLKTSGTAANGLFRPGRARANIRLYNPERDVYSNPNPFEVEFLNTSSNTVGVLVELNHFRPNISTTYGFAPSTAFLKYLTYKYPQYEMFCSLNTEDPSIPSGGTMYLADRMRHNGWRDDGDPMRCQLYFGGLRTDYNPTGASDMPRDAIATGDATLAVRRTTLDPERDSWYTPKAWLAAATHQGITYVVEGAYSSLQTTRFEKGSRVRLWWSAAHLEAAENFPIGNYEDLPISADANTMAFQAVGTHLYLFTNGPVYRFSRAGSEVNRERLLEGMSLCSRRAVCATNQAVYVATDKGFWQIDGGSGTPIRIQPLDEILQTRWVEGRSQISAAYDSALDVVIFHHAGLDEAICLWLSTNRITLLSGWKLHHLMAGPITVVDPARAQQTYNLLAITKQARVTRLRSTPPIADASGSYSLYESQTMTGTMPTAFPVVFTPTTVTYDGVYTTFGLSQPVYIHEVESGLLVALTGEGAGEAYYVDEPYPMVITPQPSVRVRGNASARIKPGDLLGVSPVRTLVVGAQLPAGGDDCLRRKVHGCQVSVSNVSGRTLQRNEWLRGDLPAVVAGILHPDDLLQTAPRMLAVAGPNKLWANPVAYGDVYRAVQAPKQPISTRRPDLNVCRLDYDGAWPLPAIRCDLPDVSFDLTSALFTGTLVGGKALRQPTD